MSAGAYVAPRRSRAAIRLRLRISAPTLVFVLVFAAQLAFGLWMSSRGFRWGDAFYRSTGALFTLHSADPKLANIGFVWMPLPGLLNLPWVALYPVWHDVVASGAASALASAVCGGATAAILVATARRLALPAAVGWAFALLVSINPMIFLYAGTGMSEGVGAPFLVGAVCCLTLFWHTGQRWWIGAAGVALGFAMASLYEAVPYGAAVFFALVAGIIWSTEARPSAPLGPARAIEGLGLLLLVPPVFVGLLWIAANAVIMGDPLYFVTGGYGYESYTDEAFTGNGPTVEGDIIPLAGLLAERVWPFAIPLAALLAVRLADGRLRRIESVSLLVIGLSVTLLLIAPMAFIGSRMDFLRYYIYPLYAAAGWGLYEIAISPRPRRAAAIVLSGWVLAVPAVLAMMANPWLATQEYPELKALVEGRDALELGYGDPVITRAALAGYVDRSVLAHGHRVLLDSYQGAAIATQVRPEHAGLLVMTFDRRFRPALADPFRHHVAYVLVPSPEVWPQDIVNRTRPALWKGSEPGFQLIKAFKPGPVTHLPEEWRLFRVLRNASVLPATSGGGG